MESITIDKLHIATHRRYAKNQAQNDPAFLKAASKVSLQSEVTGTSSIFGSNLSALFGLNLTHIPWAGFFPPARFSTQSKRFFSYRIIPDLTFPLGDKEEDKEEQDRKKRIKAFLHSQKGNKSDQDILEELLDTIFTLDDLLGKILVKKLQYHKG